MNLPNSGTLINIPALCDGDVYSLNGEPIFFWKKSITKCICQHPRNVALGDKNYSASYVNELRKAELRQVMSLSHVLLSRSALV